jgi:hypothetical protein
MLTIFLSAARIALLVFKTNSSANSTALQEARGAEVNFGSRRGMLAVSPARRM